MNREVSDQEVHFHRSPPAGLGEWISDKSGGGFLGILEDLVGDLFGFRLERHGKWLEWFFAEVLYRHCDNAGLAWFAMVLLRKIKHCPDLVDQVKPVFELVILGDATDVKIADIVKKAQTELGQEVLCNAEIALSSMRDSMRQGRKTDLNTLREIGSKPTSKELMAEQVVLLAEIVKKIKVMSAMTANGKTSEEKLNLMHAEICARLAEVAIGIPVAESAGNIREVRRLITNEIAPEVAAIIATHLRDGRKGVAGLIAERAVAAVVERMPHIFICTAGELETTCSIASSEAADLAKELGVPRLAAQASEMARQKFDEWTEEECERLRER